MFKKIAFAAMLVVAGLLFNVSPSQAQAPAMGVDCSVLGNSPFMCIKNMSRYPVVAVQASAGMFSPAGWIRIPGGMVQPGGTTIVKFNTYVGGCNQHIYIQTADGQTHSYPFTDVCHYASFIISGW